MANRDDIPMDVDGEWEFEYHYFERVVPQMKAHLVFIERNKVGINSYGNTSSSTPPTAASETDEVERRSQDRCNEFRSRQQSERLEAGRAASLRKQIAIHHREVYGSKDLVEVLQIMYPGGSVDWQNSFKGIRKVYRNLLGTFHPDRNRTKAIEHRIEVEELFKLVKGLYDAQYK